MPAFKSVPERSGGRSAERIASLLSQASTTPGRLRLASIVVVAALAVLALTGTSAIDARGKAARAVGLQAEPLLLGAEDLYVSLSDADATASRTFLHAGLEPVAERQRYVDDLNTSSNRIAAIGGQVGGSQGALHSVQLVTSDLPVYNGFVEEARANNRQGFPVGATYLNQASTLMRNQVLPEVTGLYEDAARRLSDDYSAGTSAIEPVAIVLIGITLIGLLVLVQRYVAVRSNRLINPGLAAATVIAAVVVSWALLRLVAEQRTLAQSQREGSDAVQVLSAARILLLRAASDDSLALIAHGTGDAYLKDFDETASRVGGADGRGGLLAEASGVARRSGAPATVDGLSDQFRAFLGVHRRVRQLDDAGQYKEAVDLSLGDGASASQALDSMLKDQISAAQARMDARATEARAGFGPLTAAFPVALAVAAALVLAGLQQRIGEYQ